MVGVWIVVALGGFSLTTGEPSPKNHASDDGLAQTPPMGWYPWNEFGQEPQNEQLIKEMADALVPTVCETSATRSWDPMKASVSTATATTRLQRTCNAIPADYGGLVTIFTKKDLNTRYIQMPEHTRAARQCRAPRATSLRTCVNLPTGAAITSKSTGVIRKGRGMPGHTHSCMMPSTPPGVPSPTVFVHGARGLRGRGPLPLGMLGEQPAISAPGRADWKNAMKIAFANEKLFKWAGPGHWNDPDMLIVGMPGMSEVRNRSFFSLWCMMASPLIASNDLRKMSASTIQILTNLEAIGVNQDPLGIQGHIVRRADKVSIWAGKRLYDGSQAVLVFNQQSSPADVNVDWSDIGIDKTAGLYVRNLWTHKTTGPHTNGISVTVPV